MIAALPFIAIATKRTVSRSTVETQNLASLRGTQSAAGTQNLATLPGSKSTTIPPVTIPQNVVELSP
jgi:hypothetical protein